MERKLSSKEKKWFDKSVMIKDLAVGKTIPHDVITPDGVLVISAGMRITSEIIDGLLIE